MWLVSVVIRRYIDILIIIINFPYSTCIRSFFGSSILTSLFILKMFFRSLIYTVLIQNHSCFTRKQTCNGEYTKHCTRRRHQLKMATPAEVRENRSNFRIRQFKEKRLFNIGANLTLNTMVSFVILFIARTSRIACADGHTDIQTHMRQLL